MNVSETKNERAAAEERDDAKKHEHAAENEAGANGELDENTEKVQAEENNQRAGDGGQQGTILAKKRSDGAGRGAKGNEDDGEAGNESERGSEESGAGLLALAKLLHADAGKHGGIARNERKNAGREERDQAGQEGP